MSCSAVLGWLSGFIAVNSFLISSQAFCFLCTREGLVERSCKTLRSPTSLRSIILCSRESGEARSHIFSIACCCEVQRQLCLCCRSSRVSSRIRIQIRQHCYQHPRVSHLRLLNLPERLVVRNEGKAFDRAFSVEGKVRGSAFETLGTALSVSFYWMEKQRITFRRTLNHLS